MGKSRGDIGEEVTRKFWVLCGTSGGALRSSRPREERATWPDANVSGDLPRRMQESGTSRDSGEQSRYGAKKSGPSE